MHARATSCSTHSTTPSQLPLNQKLQNHHHLLDMGSRHICGPEWPRVISIYPGFGARSARKDAIGTQLALMTTGIPTHIHK